MSKNATVTFSANVSGDSQSDSIGPLIQALTGSPAVHAYQNIQSGNTTVNVPQTPNPAQYLLIIPPSNSAVNKWLMASADSVGFTVALTLPFIVSVGAISSFVIRGSGNETLEFWWF